MVIIKSRNIETIRYESPILSNKVKKLIDKKSKCKSIEKYLEVQLKIIKQNREEWTSLELIQVFQDLIKKAGELRGNKSKIMEIEIIDGWKSNDCLDIYKGVTNDFIILSHLKDKETGEVSTTKHQIPHQNVNRILSYLKKWEILERHKCYDFAPILGFYDWKSLWKERKIYFNSYYYPVKILEKLGYISYSGRGMIKKLK